MSEEKKDATAFTPAQLAPLFAALAKAQAAFDPILKGRTVQVKSDKGSYSFDYAPLDIVIDATRPALTANGLTVLQPICSNEDGDMVLRTILAHSSGASIEGSIVMPHTDRIQGVGSNLTYMRRYAYQAIIGVVSEADDDGNAASGNERAYADKQPATRPPFMSEIDFDKAVSAWGAMTREEQAAAHAKMNGRQKALLKERRAQADRNADKMDKAEKGPSSWGLDGNKTESAAPQREPGED